jgi:hypothetical protein
MSVRACRSLASTVSRFDDLPFFVVRVSRLAVRRTVEVRDTSEKGRALHVGLMRADAKLIDPTAGSVPPIVYATLHS